MKSIAMIVGTLTISLSAGCATLSSPSEWFKPKAPTASNSQGGFAAAISNTGKGISGQFKSMGSAVSSAYAKTKSAVTSPFTSKKPANSDPTSLSHMPENLGPEIWVMNGQSHEARGDFAGALDNYTKALELEPANESALLSTARLYEKQQKHEQAADFFQKAIQVNPASGTFNELAMSFHAQGRSAEAKTAIQQAINKDPSNARYRNNYAGMLVAEGRSDEAVGNLQQVFSPAIANYNVAYLYYNNQNVAAAQQHLQAAMQMDPNLAPARELSNKIASNPTAQSAMAAYQAAGNIYRTAQATVSPTAQANQAVYQPGTLNNVPATPASSVSR